MCPPPPPLTTPTFSPFLYLCPPPFLSLSLPCSPSLPTPIFSPFPYLSPGPLPPLSLPHSPSLPPFLSLSPSFLTFSPTDTTLEMEESENHLRSTFVEARESLSGTIIADLANYRHKRVMGLAGIFGDHMLTSTAQSVAVCVSTHVLHVYIYSYWEHDCGMIIHAKHSYFQAVYICTNIHVYEIHVHVHVYCALHTCACIYMHALYMFVYIGMLK